MRQLRTKQQGTSRDSEARRFPESQMLTGAGRKRIHPTYPSIRPPLHLSVHSRIHSLLIETVPGPIPDL